MSAPSIFKVTHYRRALWPAWKRPRQAEVAVFGKGKARPAKREPRLGDHTVARDRAGVKAAWKRPHHADSRYTRRGRGRKNRHVPTFGQYHLRAWPCRRQGACSLHLAHFGNQQPDYAPQFDRFFPPFRGFRRPSPMLPIGPPAALQSVRCARPGARATMHPAPAILHSRATARRAGARLGATARHRVCRVQRQPPAGRTASIVTFQHRPAPCCPRC